MTRALERQLDRIEMALDAHGGAGGREGTTAERALRMQQILLTFLSDLYRDDMVGLQADLERQFRSSGFWTRRLSDADAEASDAMVARLLADLGAIGRPRPQRELGRVDYEEVDE